MKILVLTVGGSSEPIVSSLRQNKPDRLAFICSDDVEGTKGSYTQVEGQGLVCERNTKPNIIIRADAANIDHQIIRIKGLDDSNACYAASLQLLSELRRQYPEAQIIADYTGGTKSMSVGLVLAALDTEGVVLGLQKGVRADLEKALNDTQFTRLTYSQAPLINRQLRSVAYFFRRFDYAAAILVLEDLLATPDLLHAVSESAHQQLTLARALNAWDRFDHLTAWDLLTPFRGEYVELVKFLEAVMWSRRRLDGQFEHAVSGKMGSKPKGHGYELVQDLLLNSERRALQGRYDDAVARLYRAVELLAQAQLRYQHEVETANVEPKKLPQRIRSRYQRRRRKPETTIQLPLADAYELLMELSDYGREPLGELYVSYKGKLLDFLAIRNRSLQAHGFTPITEDEYGKAKGVTDAFCNQGIQDITKAEGSPKTYAAPVQFPQSSPAIAFRFNHFATQES